ncbi:hypothetical protein EH30_09150, partial [Erythrobacter sp. JL475]
RKVAKPRVKHGATGRERRLRWRGFQNDSLRVAAAPLLMTKCGWEGDLLSNEFDARLLGLA